MMLLYIYFLSLLLFIPLSEEEYLKSRKRIHRRNNHNEQLKRKINRLENDETLEDKEPMTHIDVASFIQSPDTSIDENQPLEDLLENRRQSLRDYDDSLIKTGVEVGNDQSQDYQSLDSANIPEVNIYNRQSVPRYNNRNPEPLDEINNDNQDVKHLKDDSFHGHHKKHKKCIFKKMKIPFFSRDKSSTAKMKKNKKRKLFTLHNSKNNSSVTKVAGSNLNSNNAGRISMEPKSFKVNKRSYYERLCPECKKKFSANLNSDWIDKCRKTANNMIHNSRQYYQNIIQDDSNNEISKSSNSQSKQNKKVNERHLYNYIDRWKRNDEVLNDIKLDKVSNTD